MAELSRRRLLRAASAGVATTLAAGCVSNTGGGGTSPQRTDETTDTTTDRTDGTTTDDGDSTKTDHVVIENRTDAERVVEIEVAQDETLIAGKFRVPAGRGLKFDREFPWETYEVRARVAGGSWTERTWEPGSCGNTPNPNGNQNLGAVVESDGEFSLVVNGCDYLKLGETYVSGYDPAAEHRVQSTGDGDGDGTTAEPTDDTKNEHVVIENRSGTEKVVEIEVSQDETLISGTFRVPAAKGLKFDREFPWERYEARARLAGGEWVERAWEPGSCANTPYPDGNQNLGAVVGDDDALELVVNGCDYLKLGETYVSGYESAEEHRVESTATTTTSD